MQKRSWQLVYFMGLLIILSVLPFSNALEVGECVIAEVADISPSSIGIGKEFTVGIQIENCGTEVPEFISFGLINPPTDITIKEPLLINISRLYYGNSERFITYHMRTNDDAHPGTHVINTRLSYGKKDFFIIKNGNITFQVIGDKAEVNIASIKTKPVLPYEGETVELTLRVENSGDGTAKSLKVYADHQFQGIKQAFIGTLDSDEDGPAIFTFIADKSGEFEFPVTIIYYDDFGEKEVKTNVKISILEKKSNLRAIIFLIIVIVIICGGFFYLIKKGKSKDKIIQQLLKGNNFSEKNKKLGKNA